MSATLEEVKNESSQELAERVDRLRTLLNATLQGKADVIEYVLVCLLARGHLLLEDQPGLGKTTLAKALAAGLGEQGWAGGWAISLP